MNWILSKVKDRKKVALITIIGKEGSGPRDIGATMAVATDGSRFGTIGGGEVESIVIKEAMSALKENKPRRLRLALRPENIPEDAIKTGMICGGIVEFFINIIQPDFRLIVIGAGNLGKPLADVAHILNYKIVVIDKNPDLANPERFPYADLRLGDIISEVDKLQLDDNDVVVIVYGEHEIDYLVLRKLIEKEFKGHIWALCSKRRAKWMIDRLREEGFNVDIYRGRIHAPAGLDISSDTPEEIAISILAEIICESKGCSKPVKSLSIMQ